MARSKRNSDKNKQRTRVVGRKRFKHRTKPGAPPGILVSDSSKGAPRVRMFRYSETKLEERSLDPQGDFPEPVAGEVLWLDVAGLGQIETIERVGQHFGLHALALEDVVHVHQRPKTDNYGDHLFIVVRTPSSEGESRYEQLSLFLGRNFVITFQEDERDCFDAVRQRIREHGRIRDLGPDFLVYTLLDAVIDSFFPKLEAYGAELDQLDEAISASPKSVQVSGLYAIRRELILVRKLLWHHREALNTLVRLEADLITAETRTYLRDCLDHTVQLMDVAETDRESCLSLQELYLSEISQRTNEVMKTLTLIATIFMPMTFVAGVYGMNFNPQASPWNMPELEWWFGYPFALGLMFLMGASMVLYFHRRGWIW